MTGNFSIEKMNLEGVIITEEFSSDGHHVSARFSLDSSHELFRVHFPGKPIVPGALLLDYVKRLCSRALGVDVTVRCVKDSRFKIAFEPVADQVMEVVIDISDPEGASWKVKACYYIADGDQRKSAASLSLVVEEVSDICFIVPFYNNSKTVGNVISSLQQAGYKVIAVNDGSDDGESLEAASHSAPFHLVSYSRNRGKGYAIRKGFQKARELGFRFALVFDADGQHTLSGAQAMIARLREMPSDRKDMCVVVGSRCTRGADSGGRFANNFSNFWLTVQTGGKVGDTQSGMRIYPLEKVCGMSFMGNRYEFETEVLVRLAWKGLEIVEVPVDVLYPQDRVTHFRKGKDFMRISLMNTYLTLGALFWGYPCKLFRKVFKTRGK